MIELVQEAHDTARKNGFWGVCSPSTNEAKSVYLASKLALIHSEVSEALEELRGQDRGEEFLEELADVVIRTFDLAGSLDDGADRFCRILVNKMQKNKEREYKHGKAF